MDSLNVVMTGPFASYPKGTVSVRMLPIAEALQMRGHKITLVLPPYDNIKDSGKNFCVSGINIYNIKMMNKPNTVLRLFESWNLYRKALAFKPDVLHIFKPKGYSGMVAMFTNVRNRFFYDKIPLVLDSDDWQGRGGINDVIRVPNLWKTFFEFQERWISTHVQAITVASRYLQTKLTQFGVPHERIFYVPNGPPPYSPTTVDARETERLRKSLNLTGFKSILFYTRFFESDPNRVIKIFQSVRSKIKNVKLVVIGKGISGEESLFLYHAKKGGLMDYIVYAGWIDRRYLPLYLSLSEIAIYPFDDTILNRSKCPGKLVELMSLGKAIVADKVGQIPEYIEDENSGLLIEGGDVEKFAEALVKVLTDENFSRHLGANARQRINEHFGWNRLVLHIEQAYKLATNNIGR